MNCIQQQKYVGRRVRMAVKENHIMKDKKSHRTSVILFLHVCWHSKGNKTKTYAFLCVAHKSRI